MIKIIIGDDFTGGAVGERLCVPRDTLVVTSCRRTAMTAFSVSHSMTTWAMSPWMRIAGLAPGVFGKWLST